MNVQSLTAIAASFAYPFRCLSALMWYPISGFRNNSDGSLLSVGYSGSYWSASPVSGNAYCLNFSDNGRVYPSNGNGRSYGQSVRCLQE